MNILINLRKQLKTTLAIAVFLLPSISFSNDIHEELESLKGTWILNYNHNGTEFTSTINLNEIRSTDEENERIFGTIVINQEETEQVFSCKKQDAALINSFGTDFFCTTVVEPIHIYSLRFSGDFITNGLFARGDTIMDASVNIIVPTNRSPVIGFRDTGESVYDEETGLVAIPVLSIKGELEKFSVILQKQGTENLLFTVTDVVPNLNVDSSTKEAVYEAKTGLVTIPIVSVKGKSEKFSVTLQQTDELIFNVLQVEEISRTPCTLDIPPSINVDHDGNVTVVPTPDISC